MYQKPPPIQLLVTFEAAARHSSFKKAGLEISITASAISQQIKQLEEYLGTPLFLRLTRKIELTEAGIAFQRIAQHTLETYHSGYGAFQQQFSKPTIRLSVVPFVAFELLIPHLHELTSASPEIDLRIETSMALVDFEQEPIDAAIRFGLGDWPGLHCHVLAPAQASLMASPDLLLEHPIRNIEDLANHTLIHTRNSENDWDKVAKMTGVTTIPHKAELVFDTYLAAMKAAENGLGIAIGLFPLNNNWIASDRLQPVVPPIDTAYKHYFVYRKNSPKQEQLRQVQHWIQQRFDELAATPTD